MKKTLLSLFSICLSASLIAQITVTQADYGQAGDSIVVGYDNAPPANLAVGGTGMQTWDFTTLSLNNINTLKFEDPINTTSGVHFPNADLAIERQADTIFFQSSASAFVIDGISGDGFNLGVSVLADFNPNSTQIEFPSTLNDTYIDTAIFDTTVSCAAIGFGTTCDSARLKRKLIGTSEIDAYGFVSTPGGTFESIRQYYREFNMDTVWAKFPFVGWTIVEDSQSVVHNYRWIANGEDWPVLNAQADAQNGDIITAEYKIGDQVLGFAESENNPSCFDGCNGSASVYAVGGLPPYTYAWPDGQTSPNASGLCAGAYVVTITDDNGSTYEVDIELTNPSAVSIAGAVQGVNVESDGAIDITVSGGAGSYTYEWSGPDGFTATTADISGLDIGDYTVVATDQNDCDTSRTFTVDLTGIATLDGSGFKSFPNPANDHFTLRSNNIIKRAKLTDLLGNVVLEVAPQKNHLEISTSTMAQGIYLIEVETVIGSYLDKITIRH